MTTSLSDAGVQFADSSVLLSAAYSFGFKNRVINGAMKIDQRNVGASQSFTAAAALAYSIDRFYGFCTGANVTGQRIALANAQNRYRFTGLAGVTGVGFGQRIESFNSLDLAGLNASLQVKLFSSSLTAITWTAYYATTVDTFGTLATPTRTQFATGSFTIGAAEATYSALLSVPAAATTGIEIVFTAGALLGAQTLTIGDVQLEAGSQATSFELERLQSVLSNCQRYYFKTLDAYTVQGNADSSTRQLISTYNFPVTLRATPTGLTGAYSAFTNCTQASFTASVSSSVTSIIASAVGGFTALLTWGAFSAEL